MASALQLQMADELLRRLSAAVRATQLYSPSHPIVGRNLEALSATLQVLHMVDARIVVGMPGGRLVVADTPVVQHDALNGLVARFQACGLERLVIERGVTGDELAQFANRLGDLSRDGSDDHRFEGLEHIRVGRIHVEPRVTASMADLQTVRRLYSNAVQAAGQVWDAASTEGRPDASVARATVDDLAEAVSQNRRALVALTTLKNYDNYTFTHMVNVSVLSMGQARGLGIEGALLREIGLAGLMHDIGKVRTPLEILQKPGGLTEAEFAIMKRHPVEGAEMLRQTPDMPALAPVVAFEHHLRRDGTGYPNGVARPSLNLATMICSIADVFDAMRSQRPYQQAFPSDRVLQVLRRNDGAQFDQHLVRRFVQLIGIYPLGSLVRLDTGELAVVSRVHAPEPHRPQVRLLQGRRGERLPDSPVVNLWEATAGRGVPSTVTAPVEPADHPEIDALGLM